MIGQTLSHFKITSKLGEGGMGEVYRAEDTKLGREVAIKVLPEAVSKDPERLARFQREAQVLASLNHPNIAAIFQVEKADDTHFLVMELVEGESLADKIHGRALPLKQALGIVTSIASALSTAHAKGIVHRDLKPANVMVNNEGQVKVLDFGLAKLTEPAEERARDLATQLPTQAATLTREGMVVGTAAYMSPEQAAGKPVDARSDLFSLGSILYESTTGTRPFGGDSAIDTLHNVIHAESLPLAESIPDAPLQLQWITRKCLAKSPEERYQLARDLTVDLKALQQDLESGSAVPSVATLRAAAASSSDPKRSKLLLPLSVSAAVALAAGLGWFLWQSATIPLSDGRPSGPISMRPVTTSGNINAAAISPDGKYVTYVEMGQGVQSLHLRQLDGPESIELILPQDVWNWGLSFDNDSTNIIFAQKSQDNLLGSFYKISALGGTPKKLLDHVDGPPAFSHDGARMSWLRANYPESDQSAVMIANVDGTDERILSTRTRPELVARVYYSAPSWSPDDLLIAVSVVTLTGDRKGVIEAIRVDTGETVWKADQQFVWSSMVAWLPEGDGLLAIAQRTDQDRTEVWLMPYPTGPAHQVTSDLTRKRIVSLSADGQSLLTVLVEDNSSMWITRRDRSTQDRKISKSHADGLSGFDFTSDGRIIYQTSEAGKLDIAIMNADGSGRRLLTDDVYPDGYPQVTSDGRIVYLSGQRSGTEIRTMDLEGGDVKVVTSTSFRSRIDLSPGGKWIYYDNWIGGQSRIWRVSIEGGAPEKITDLNAWMPTVSPDGDRLALYYRIPGGGEVSAGVIPIEGGPVSPVMARASIASTGTFLSWNESGDGLLMNILPGDRSNLWNVPLDGSDPERLTDFAEDRLYWFGHTPDGESLVYSRGPLVRDAVLIENFR